MLIQCAAFVQRTPILSRSLACHVPSCDHAAFAGVCMSARTEGEEACLSVGRLCLPACSCNACVDVVLGCHALSGASGADHSFSHQCKLRGLQGGSTCMRAQISQGQHFAWGIAMKYNSRSSGGQSVPATEQPQNCCPLLDSVPLEP